MPGSCPKWGDGSKWGDGDLWCSISGTFAMIAWADGRPGETLAVWNLQSPDGTIWTPSITTAGILSFTSGAGTATEVPVLVAPTAGTVYTPTISNAGIVTITSGTDTAQKQAVIIDSSGVTWFWMVLVEPISTLSTEQLTGSALKLHHISLRVEHPGGDAVTIDSLRLLAQVAAQNLSRSTAWTDFDTFSRLSVQLQHAGGGEVVLQEIIILANVKKHQPKG